MTLGRFAWRDRSVQAAITAMKQLGLDLTLFTKTQRVVQIFTTLTENTLKGWYGEYEKRGELPTGYA